MKKLTKHGLMWAALVAYCSSAAALDYKSLADNGIVYDAGSRQANPQFILLRGTPVEVIVTVEKWVKVREQSGGMGWVERSSLSDVKNVIATTPTEVRQQPDATSPVIYSVAKDVLLEAVEKPIGAWLKVKHRDGQVGYVAVKAVWGI